MDGLDSPTLVLKKKADGHILIKKAKLFVVSGEFQGREFVLDKDCFSIGVSSDGDLVLPDETVSKRHCEIQLCPGGYVVKDLGSTNGTFVNGVRVSEAFLGQGTEIQLGKTRVVFCPLQEMREFVLSERTSIGRVLGASVAMRRVFHEVETYAPTDATILIEGETGSGKEVLAEEIHGMSRRKDKPFMVIDCTALARDLIESELFGHQKGSFTGANLDRVGAFEHADGGTVFLDEIADLAPELQPKLLRVLEKREVKRVGSNAVRRVDVRIISATNRRLANEVQAGRFREDLFFRLSIARIEMPPLRARKDDIPILAEHFLRMFLGEDAMSQVANFDKAMEMFLNHSWPGNVRELRNMVEVACYSQKRPVDLSAFIYMGVVKTEENDGGRGFSADRPFKDAKGDLVRKFEIGYVEDLLRKHNGNVSRAAREAGIERAYLQRLIRKHDLKN
jgi:transcriptional regulator with PAS, ATPase and Fis domain